MLKWRSHRCVGQLTLTIVVPRTTSSDDMSRLKSLCSIHGVGLATILLDNDAPDYVIVILLALASPGMFYVNTVLVRLKCIHPPKTAVGLRLSLGSISVVRVRKRSERFRTGNRLIPTLTDIHPCAHWRSPMDMMRQG